jgi:hypothetical protein
MLETLIAGSIPVWKAYQRYLIDVAEIRSVKNGKNVLERAANGRHRPEWFAAEF